MRIILGLIGLLFLSACYLKNNGKAVEVSKDHSQLLQNQLKVTYVDSIKSSAQIVTTQVVKVKDKYFGYIGGEGKFLESFEVNEKGLFRPLKKYLISEKFGGIRGLIDTKINGKSFLIVGNKAENSVEVHQIDESGILNKVSTVSNTDTTYLKQNVTIHLIEIEQQQFVFIGGLDTGMSCFKLSDQGQLDHVQSIKDTDKLFLDGIIGMASLEIDGQFFLFTGGFMDDGISSFKIFKDGTFENVDNVADDNTLFLTGTFSLNAVSFLENNYLLVGNRHKAHYPAYKEEGGLIYHGDGINVFKVNPEGKLEIHQLLKDEETLNLKGITRIESINLKKNKTVVFIATRDDRGIQVCNLNKEGNLQPIYKIDNKYAVYNGMTLEKINSQWFLFTGGYDKKIFNSYAIHLLEN